MDNENKAGMNRRLALKLLWIIVGAMLFVIAMVPLYNVLCRVAGLNGRPEAAPAKHANALKVDQSRWVTVQFTGNVMPGLAWDFAPRQNSVRVHPGQNETVSYFARNTTNSTVTGQAVPSISPAQAVLYFKKIECFCFRLQELKAGEAKDMALRFYVSPELPEGIQTITLSYAFYKVANQPVK
jgi:cytochrome c oxidase assembly protein subunit 11